MKIKSRCLAIMLLGLAPVATEASAVEPATFGYLENVLVYPARIAMKAKLDTGADNSAIHAVDIVKVRRAGVDWVTFNVVTKMGQSLHLERPVVRTAEIKRRSGPPQKRPVVMLEICLGTIKRTVEVGLVDRDHFDFRVLIGRSFMAGHALVDSGREFTTEPSCR